MAKIYLKKVPSNYSCHGCYFSNKSCQAVWKDTSLITMCVKDNIKYIKISKPIKSIHDIPKPGGKK